MLVNIKVNGINIQDDVRPDQLLFDFLRDHGFKSVKCGCETTNCGLCTVWMDDKSVLSCSVLTVRADGHAITTLEGVQEEAKEFADFMAREGAEQCGFCSPGLIMNVLMMRREIKEYDAENVGHYLAGNLCRCTGYMGQMRAIEKFLQRGEGE